MADFDFSTDSVDVGALFEDPAAEKKAAAETAPVVADSDVDPSEVDQTFINKTYQFISENTHVIALLVALVIIAILIWVFLIKEDDKKQTSEPDKGGAMRRITSSNISAADTAANSARIRAEAEFLAKERKVAEENTKLDKIRKDAEEAAYKKQKQKMEAEAAEMQRRQKMKAEAEAESWRQQANTSANVAPKPGSGSDLFTVEEEPAQSDPVTEVAVIDQAEVDRRLNEICSEFEDTSESTAATTGSAPAVIEDQSSFLGDAEVLIGGATDDNCDDSGDFGGFGSSISVG